MTGKTGFMGRGVANWRNAGFIAFFAAVIVLLSVPVAPVAMAQSNSVDARVKLVSGRTTATVNVARGKPKTVRTDQVFQEIVVGDPEIATVKPLTDQTFYVLGKAVGTTGIALFDENQSLVGMVDVEVTHDVRSLNAKLRQKLKGSNIKASTANGRIVLDGRASDSVSAREAVALAERYDEEVINSVSVEGSQQVMLEVRFVEAQRTRNKEVGLQWNIFNEDFLVSVGAPALISGATPFGAAIGQLIGDGISADALVQALEERGLGRRLAEPNLIAMSGETASFLAGGEFPIPVQSDENTITVEFKKFGVGLEFKPTVLKDGLINLVISPEVSQIDTTVSVVINDIQIPGLSVRRATTTVELRTGQSFVIAGLLQSGSTYDQRRLPWLADVPILGALFRSASFRRNETDLVIIVTPHLVEPLTPGQHVATPFDGSARANDVDLFLNGKNEVPRKRVAGLSEKTEAGLPTGHILDLP
ncbi:MAG: type II and III secretion system protein family protein [Pseudomonadota bacterium]